MAKDSTPKQPQKKTKTSKPVSKSRAMRITKQENIELDDVTEASEFNGHLSPLVRKLIKKSLESKLSLDLNAINKTVLKKEDGGYSYCRGMPKKRDTDEEGEIEQGKEKDNNKEKWILVKKRTYMQQLPMIKITLWMTTTLKNPLSSQIVTRQQIFVPPVAKFCVS